MLHLVRSIMKKHVIYVVLVCTRNMWSTFPKRKNGLRVAALTPNNGSVYRNHFYFGNKVFHQPHHYKKTMNHGCLHQWTKQIYSWINFHQRHTYSLPVKMSTPTNLNTHMSLVCQVFYQSGHGQLCRCFKDWGLIQVRAQTIYLQRSWSIARRV